MSESWQEAESLEGSIFLQDGLRILARIIARDIASKPHLEPDTFAHPETYNTQKQ